MPYKIAIVGMGPKGLFAFESLVTELEIYGATVDLEIFLFEASGSFGCGKIYETDQPGFLSMNYPNRNIDVWGSRGIGLGTDRPSLTKFLLSGRTDVREEIGDRFSSRATVGSYLRSCFNELKTLAENYASVTMITGTVREIELSEKSIVLRYKQGDGNLGKGIFDQVMITTGHDTWKGALQEYGISVVDRESDIPFIYPVLENFRSISSYATVGIKGLGLTFIDAVLALTIGRDGTFLETETGTLLYEPSSLEPKKLTAFSRSGMPMVPRAPFEGKETYSPTFFTYDNIMQNVLIGGRPDFLSDILPLFEKEMELRYYRVLAYKEDYVAPDSRSFADFDSWMDKLHIDRPEIPRFNCDLLFRPVTMERPDIELGPMAYSRYILKEAETGSDASPFMAAALTWGCCSEVFNSIYSFGGLTADSQRLFDMEYRSKLNRLTYGPPVSNAKKILALMEHGLLDVLPGATLEMHRLATGWLIHNADGNDTIVDTMVDARIPNNKSIDNWSPLLKSMRQNGLVREYINPGSDSYSSACPEIDRCGRPLDLTASPSEQITFYGSLTEGMTYDNDTLSRTRNDFASDWSVRCMEEILKE